MLVPLILSSLCSVQCTLHCMIFHSHLPTVVLLLLLIPVHQLLHFIWPENINTEPRRLAPCWLVKWVMFLAFSSRWISSYVWRRLHESIDPACQQSVIQINGGYYGMVCANNILVIYIKSVIGTLSSNSNLVYFIYFVFSSWKRYLPSAMD